MLLGLMGKNLLFWMYINSHLKCSYSLTSSCTYGKLASGNKAKYRKYYWYLTDTKNICIYYIKTAVFLTGNIKSR